jgi:putative FmdB family regulatory protein
MPLYEYRCENGHTFEVMQRMSDDPVQTCEVCGAPVQRVFHPVAVHFKGSGFYNTDYGKKRRGAAASDDSSGSSDGKSSDSSGSSDSSSSSSDSGKSEKSSSSTSAASSSSSSSSD